MFAPQAEMLRAMGEYLSADAVDVLMAALANPRQRIEHHGSVVLTRRNSANHKEPALYLPKGADARFGGKAMGAMKQGLAMGTPFFVAQPNGKQAAFQRVQLCNAWGFNPGPVLKVRVNNQNRVPAIRPGDILQFGFDDTFDGVNGSSAQYDVPVRYAKATSTWDATNQRFTARECNPDGTALTDPHGNALNPLSPTFYIYGGIAGSAYAGGSGYPATSPSIVIGNVYAYVPDGTNSPTPSADPNYLSSNGVLVGGGTVAIQWASITSATNGDHATQHSFTASPCDDATGSGASGSVTLVNQIKHGRWTALFSGDVVAYMAVGSQNVIVSAIDDDPLNTIRMTLDTYVPNGWTDITASLSGYFPMSNSTVSSSPGSVATPSTTTGDKHNHNLDDHATDAYSFAGTVFSGGGYAISGQTTSSYAVTAADFGAIAANLHVTVGPYTIPGSSFTSAGTIAGTIALGTLTGSISAGTTLGSVSGSSFTVSTIELDYSTSSHKYNPLDACTVVPITGLSFAGGGTVGGGVTYTPTLSGSATVTAAGGGVSVTFSGAPTFSGTFTGSACTGSYTITSATLTPSYYAGGGGAITVGPLTVTSVTIPQQSVAFTITDTTSGGGASGNTINSQTLKHGYSSAADGYTSGAHVTAGPDAGVTIDVILKPNYFSVRIIQRTS